MVAPGWVLTAWHVVQGAEDVGVWLGVTRLLDPSLKVVVDPNAVRWIEELDLALLPIPEAATPEGYRAPPFGCLDRSSSTPVPVAGIGFPWFKLTDDPDVKTQDPVAVKATVRESRTALGHIIGTSNDVLGRLEWRVTDGAPPPRPPEPKKPAWGGMSGAAVFTAPGGVLLGVVGEQPPNDPGSLTVRPLLAEQGPGGTTVSAQPYWADLLDQLSDPLQPFTVTPPSARDRANWLAVEEARMHLPEGQVLVSRGSDLADLERFAADPDQHWRWIQADAFAGKTALLAWFSLNPPENVDVVACFLWQARKENTINYVLEVLTEQLTALAGGDEPHPTHPGPWAHWVAKILLPNAAKVSTNPGRRLLLIVDGLDEYDVDDARQTPAEWWLPDQTSLPDKTALIVASRHGADVSLPTGHPLKSAVARLTPSDVADAVRRQALAELEDAKKGEAPLRSWIGACLAGCGGQISRTDLAALLARVTQQQVSPEWLKDLTDIWYHRTIQTRHSAGRDLLAFAHQSLLEQATETTFAGQLPVVRQQLDIWACECTEAGWPSETPDYFLFQYQQLLCEQKDAQGLTALLLDDRWQTRLRSRSKGDAVELACLREAIAALAGAEQIDLSAIGLLARRSDELMRSYARMPRRLPAVAARAGSASQAISLAALLRDDDKEAGQIELLLELAPAGSTDLLLEAPGILEQVRDYAAAVGSPDMTAAALALIPSEGDALDRFSVAFDLARLFSRSGDGQVARSLVEQLPGLAVQAAAEDPSLEGAESVGRAMLALGLAEAGFVPEAREMAQEIEVENLPGDAQQLARWMLLLVSAFAGDVEGCLTAFDAALEDPDDEFERLELRAEIGGCLARGGQAAAAATMVEQAEALLRSLPATRLSGYRRSRALVGLAQAYAELRDPDAARAAADEIPDGFEAQKAEALTAAAQALLESGAIETAGVGELVARVLRLSRGHVAPVLLASDGAYGSALAACTAMAKEGGEHEAAAHLPQRLARFDAVMRETWTSWPPEDADAAPAADEPSLATLLEQEGANRPYPMAALFFDVADRDPLVGRFVEEGGPTGYVLQEAIDRGGNLGALAEHMRSASTPQAGLTAAMAAGGPVASVARLVQSAAAYHRDVEESIAAAAWVGVARGSVAAVMAQSNDLLLARQTADCCASELENCAQLLEGAGDLAHGDEARERARELRDTALGNVARALADRSAAGDAVDVLAQVQTLQGRLFYLPAVAVAIARSPVPAATRDAYLAVVHDCGTAIDSDPYSNREDHPDLVAAEMAAWPRGSEDYRSLHGQLETIAARAVTDASDNWYLRSRGDEAIPVLCALGELDLAEQFATVTTDGLALRSLAETLARDGRRTEAVALADRCEDSPAAVALIRRAVALADAEVGDAASAEQALDLLLPEGLRVVVPALLKRAAAEGRYDDLERLWQKWDEYAEVAESAAVSLAAAPNGWQRARSFVEDHCAGQNRAHALLALARVAADQKRLDDAAALVAQAWASDCRWSLPLRLAERLQSGTKSTVDYHSA